LLNTFADLQWDGHTRGFPLPLGILPDGEDWHPMTVQWWDTWRTSAQAMKFADTDWNELLSAALLHHQLWVYGRTTAAAELRARVTRLGATISDRIALRMNLVMPGDEDRELTAPSSPEVTDIASRRSRLSG
jgi:hypothetical protein